MAAIDEFNSLRAELFEAQQRFDDVSAQRTKLEDSLKQRLTVDAIGRFGVIRESEINAFDDVCRQHAHYGERVRCKFGELLEWLKTRRPDM